jgi:tetratricopeptide (TPR) repeat protein
MQGGKAVLIILYLHFFVTVIGQEQTSTSNKRNIERIFLCADSIAMNNSDSAANYVLSFIKKEKLNDYNICQLYFKAGQLFKQGQQYDAANKNYSNALTLASVIKDKELQLDILLDLGRVQRRLGNYDKALGYDLKSLSIIDSINNPNKLALIYNLIGIDHYRYRNFDEAILFFNRSLHIRELNKDSVGIADCYNNLGMVYDDQGENENALNSYQKSLAVYEKIQELDGIASSYNNIAGIYYQQNDLQKVMDYILKSLEIRKKEGDHRKLSFTLLNIASLYDAMGDTDQSIQYNSEGLQLAKMIGAKSQKRIAYQGLSKAYQKKNDFKQAYQYHLLYAQVNDSIFEENKTRTITEMQVKYESEKKEFENQILKNENQIKSRNQILLIIALIGLFIIIILLTYYLRLRSKNLKQEKQHLEDKVFAEKQINRLQKEKFENELKHKNNQLANSTLSLIHKNEVLGTLKEKIKSNSNEKNGEIISYINQNMDMDNDWKKFKIEFEEVHPAFFKQLNDTWPDLSETYIKICAYLRIDLSSREIADLLHVTVAAVNKNRQRLRKKLNLEAEADLCEFLKQI